ncbi:hypothetical protein GCM10007897_35310 [Sphingobium jiangsuense]|uniref:Ca2+-binding EF-hand superfamily protein n=1 Tax=Sphingobium jiangsuense TaxID=870476 RepID=A0A7W6FNH1_9SPHN|nr:EF-hand domain-containing protein [Sphingobium jiangsuense]MBB3924537.1 Ca2+-binding EF-hand superfamily protein [Sphingobium jiangsuense]GLT02127.1 hypothetical protein GCM10007897_35310 [Sphingobium jiangsuense]
MKKSLLIAGAAILAVAAPAIAASQATPRPAAPAGKDITRAEAEAKVKEYFALFDANKDGAVTKEEITARRDAARTKWRAERFNALDKDGNGAISRAEFDAAHQGRAGRADGKRGGPGHHRMGGGMKGGGMSIAKADANKDGRITLAEATSAALAHFDKMDANKDGTVTVQERRDAMKQMREQWKQNGPHKGHAAPANPS